MTKPARLEAALSRIEDRWDEARTERTLASLHGKRRARRHRRQLLSAAAVVCVLGTLGFWQLRDRKPVAVAVVARHAEEPREPLQMQLPDGSTVTLRDEQTRVITESASAQLVQLELLEGQARFEVTPNKARLFRVQSGDVRIEVLGTAFEVEREAERSHVVVLRGRVAVLWNGERSELVAGDSGWFPRAREVAAAPATAEPVAKPLRGNKIALHKRAHSTAPAAVSSNEVTGESGWRETAESGDFERAYELLQHAPSPPNDSVEELLLAADTARISGHPKAALPFLRRVIAEHGSDSRAPLAAFTLGGILMQQLGQPREAEAAYARARELSPSSALAEDALARQVEAASRAGDRARAAALAGEYLEHYPSGRRVHAVQRFGSLSAD